MITSGTGEILVYGQGGTNGAAANNHGVYIANSGGQISHTGTGGSVEIVGTGGGSNARGFPVSRRRIFNA